MILHEIFLVVSRFHRYISRYIAESQFPLGQSLLFVPVFVVRIVYFIYSKEKAGITESKVFFLTEYCRWGVVKKKLF